MSGLPLAVQVRWVCNITLKLTTELNTGGVIAMLTIWKAWGGRALTSRLVCSFREMDPSDPTRCINFKKDALKTCYPQGLNNIDP